MNKKCQELMKGSNADAARGELLMLYTVVDLLEERTNRLQNQLDNTMADTVRQIGRNIDEIERAVKNSRDTLRRATTDGGHGQGSSYSQGSSGSYTGASGAGRGMY